MSRKSSESGKTKIDFLISLFEGLNGEASNSTNNEIKHRNVEHGVRETKSVHENSLISQSRRRGYSLDKCEGEIVTDFNDFMERTFSPAHPSPSKNDSKLQKARNRAKQVQRQYEKSLSMEVDKYVQLPYRKKIKSSYDFGTILSANKEDIDDLSDEDEEEIDLKFDEIFRNNQCDEDEDKTYKVIIQEDYYTGDDDIFKSKYMVNRYSDTSSNFTTGNNLSNEEEVNIESKFKDNESRNVEEYTFVINKDEDDVFQSNRYSATSSNLPTDLTNDLNKGEKDDSTSQYNDYDDEKSYKMVFQEDISIGEDDVFKSNFIDNRYSGTSSNFTTELTDDEYLGYSDNNVQEFFKDRPVSVTKNETDIEEDAITDLEQDYEKDEKALVNEEASFNDDNNNYVDEKNAALEMFEKVKQCEGVKKLEIVADSDDCYVELRRPETTENIYENMSVVRGNRGSQTKSYCVMVFDYNQNMRLKTILPVPPNNRPKSKKDRKDYVIDELIETEDNYIQALDYTLEMYKPYIEEHSKSGSVVGKSCYIFCNLSKISADSKEFLHDLKKKRNNYNDIAKVFHRHKNLFDRYPVYCSNKKKSYSYMTGDFKHIIAKREKELNEKLGLSSYLLKPIQRLGKYEVLLRTLAKYMKADGLNIKYVQSAIDIIVKTARKSNDILTLGSIINNPFTFSQTGELIQVEQFQLINPKKMDMYLFLFKKIVIFTTKDTKDFENYIYYDSIAIDSLSKTVNESDGYFTLENFHTKKKRGGGVYTLTAKDFSNKTKWLDIIDEMLWDQLKKCKRQVEQQHGRMNTKSSLESKNQLSVLSVGKKVELVRNKHKSYPNQKTLAGKSKFYRNFST